MTKVAILGDIHYGIRNDNKAMLDHAKSFFDGTFFPYLKDNNIQHVIQLGDLVDRRKFINFNTARRLREDFLLPLEQNNIQTHILCGNHDVSFRNTNELNALDELLGGKYKNIHTYISATTIDIDGFPFLLLPWITEDNHEDAMFNIYNTNAQVCLGHLEINGFEMHRGTVCHTGMDASILEKFDLVISGHFHHKSRSKNILYTGSFMEFTWSDFGDKKGFYVYDTDTRDIKFIENPVTTHVRYVYNDGPHTDLYTLLTFDIKPEEFKNKFVKVVVKVKNNNIWLEQVCEKIDQAGPLSLQVIDETAMELDVDDDSVIDEAESTLDILKKYADKMTSGTEKNKALESYIISLYNEAVETQKGLA
jgi:DNA repair exonuclease SbcCD nuclease subunit